MSNDITQNDLMDIFRGDIDQSVIYGIYHDVHGNCREAMGILEELRKETLIQKSKGNAVR